LERQEKAPNNATLTSNSLGPRELVRDKEVNNYSYQLQKSSARGKVQGVSYDSAEQFEIISKKSFFWDRRKTITDALKRLRIGVESGEQNLLLIRSSEGAAYFKINNNVEE
jgi:hypothetical protein